MERSTAIDYNMVKTDLHVYILTYYVPAFYFAVKTPKKLVFT